MLRNDEPSFSSMNEKSFESRRVRIQPCTRTASIGTQVRSTSLIEIGETCVISERATFNAQRSTLNVQPSTFKLRAWRFGVRGHVRAFKSGPAVAGSPHSKI